MSVPFGNLSQADPRLGDQADIIGTSVETKEGHLNEGQDSAHRNNSVTYTDSSVTFDEYHWWANKSRAFEKTLSAKDGRMTSTLDVVLGKKPKTPPPPAKIPVALSEKSPPSDTSQPGTESSPERAVDSYGIGDEQYYHAQRSMRTATWGAIFYLITTDILGPYSVPWSLSQLGYGPGAGLFIAFGILAAYSGLQLWQIFIGMDSTKYPLRNYGDAAFRIYGWWARHLVNVLQSFQFFLNVSLLIVTYSQSLYQMSAGRSGSNALCFVACQAIFTVCGMVLGQIRTLARLGWLANLAIWLNVIVIIMTMVVCSVYPPNYTASQATYNTPPNQPIVVSGNWPPGLQITDHVNGLMNAVFAYGGATLFFELMAEMRRPWDFWKALICAEIFIFSVYITMGFVVYSYQGQYTYNPAFQGIPNSAYSWQTLGNAVSFISALIAALLYSNIGVKVLYAAIFRDIFHFPNLNEKTGKLLWMALIPIYWSLSFVLAAAIPQVSNLGAFVGAACILQFSYTFPPILYIGFNVQKDSILPEEEFDPVTRVSQHVDSGWKRMVRGYKKKMILNSINMVYFLGALATAGLGIYASCISMHEVFTSPTGNVKAFSCDSPTG